MDFTLLGKRFFGVEKGAFASRNNWYAIPLFTTLLAGISFSVRQDFTCCTRYLFYFEFGFICLLLRCGVPMR